MNDLEFGVFMYLAFMLGMCFGFLVGWLSVVHRITDRKTRGGVLPERECRHEKDFKTC
jgi:hypothetical protein